MSEGKFKLPLEVLVDSIKFEFDYLKDYGNDREPVLITLFGILNQSELEGKTDWVLQKLLKIKESAQHQVLPLELTIQALTKRKQKIKPKARKRFKGNASHLPPLSFFSSNQRRAEVIDHGSAFQLYIFC